ncbi:lysosomal amino acid transporter 1 homolog [Sinocyclocheilus rhinocerous]|uniref:Lysosomal amino acid transporter 1 homolog n=1 Tax=Sinocyclocheilus rhinocerous TaxID=307959 RepID=A0A673KVN8_9TELE|nr:PREDICTED: lysosomal amino acid transporter 1 homolog [Sinocyclocheilus rhinocerous]XP_016390019.1 PREDICTED: lysosomal amino acid transporter 1 homolog [Sinocyclocheilus rhinocerous]XP_016390020.1 PREDICTED: lysosomal amino acid transporter 1 homolog [Sinocyclocheilus rhinocerous]XP_016390021.1 PREDICTED: lysosomal amino acid transporter 1 homolog [Sinocyclocheilus rhinocerous]XP_016390022.1 PREDICTED: lysosomal amino acid transporter 1 homolog [Sinocyclocheilus rhinocerous]XP_016390024.1 
MSEGLVLGGDGNFSSLCPHGIEWIWYGLGECAQDGRDIASVVLGLLSIVCFMVSSLPQYYSSCKTGNMDSALSIWFLLFWLAGDSCNLIGSFLADQLPLQKYTAVYYVLADLLMLSMYFYYKLKNKSSRASNSALLNAVSVLCLLGMSSSLLSLPRSALEEQMPVGFKGRVLLAVEGDSGSVQPFDTKEIIGFVIGSISSVLYLCSRLPQMYTNFRRKSTEGVSFFLFALVILGNTTYGISVLLKNPDPGQGEASYILHHLPWLIGSLGTLSLDIIISVQFMMYSKSPRDSADGDEETAALLHN